MANHKKHATTRGAVVRLEQRMRDTFAQWQAFTAQYDKVFEKKYPALLQALSEMSIPPQARAALGAKIVEVEAQAILSALQANFLAVWHELSVTLPAAYRHEGEKALAPLLLFASTPHTAASVD